MKPIRPPRPKKSKKSKKSKQKPETESTPSVAARVGRWFRSWRRSTHAAHTRAAQRKDAPRVAPATALAGRAPPGGTLHVGFAELDVAAAADGALRGRADPLLLLAVFAIDDKRARLVPVLRSVVRYRLPRAAPCLAPPDVGEVRSTPLKSSARALVIATVWEENSGADVRALASALERPDELHLVDLSHATPEVHTAYEAARAGLPELVTRGVLVDHKDPARTRSDQWVGAGAVVVETSHFRTSTHRLALRSADGRQDWTLSFSTKRS